MSKAEKKIIDGKEYTKVIETDFTLYTHETENGYDANFEGNLEARCSDAEVCGFVKHFMDIFAGEDKQKKLHLLEGVAYLYKKEFGYEEEEVQKPEEEKQEKEEPSKDIEVRVIKINGAKGLKDVLDNMFKD